MAGDRRIGRLGLPALAALVAVPTLYAARSSAPDLVETTVVASRAATTGELRVTDTTRNVGSASAPRSLTGFYLSRDRTRDSADVSIGSRIVRSLQPYAVSRRTTTFGIPAATAPGAYHVIACADDRRRLPEAAEANNCRASLGVVAVGDETPPTFRGLQAATTCIPGPIGEGRSSSYHLRWPAAEDDVTPQSKLVYDVYQATTAGAERFGTPTYTTAAGATSFATPPLPSTTAFFFVVRARDGAGNHDGNKVERVGTNLCE